MPSLPYSLSPHRLAAAGLLSALGFAACRQNAPPAPPPYGSPGPYAAPGPYGAPPAGPAPTVAPPVPTTADRWQTVTVPPWVFPIPQNWSLPTLPGWTPWPAAGAPSPAPGAPVPGTAAPAPAGGGDRDAALRSLALVNAARSNPAFAQETGGRAPPLQWDEGLARVALAHSQDMLARGYFGHSDPDGHSPTDRINAAGIPWSSAAENIAISQSVDNAHNAFMDEPPFQANHRHNILDPNLTLLGVGVVRDARGMVYVTQDFRRAP